MSVAFSGRNAFPNASRSSNESYYRRPRPHCADRVFVTSTSAVFFADGEGPRRETERGGKGGGIVVLRQSDGTNGVPERYETQMVTLFVEKEGEIIDEQDLCRAAETRTDHA